MIKRRLHKPFAAVVNVVRNVFAAYPMIPTSSGRGSAPSRRSGSGLRQFLGMAGGLVLASTLTMFGPSPAGATNPTFVGLASTATGHGYWLVSSSGTEQPLGDAATLTNSLCDSTFAPPVVGIAPTPDHGGYWEVTAKGSLACFGRCVILWIYRRYHP